MKIVKIVLWGQSHDVVSFCVILAVDLIIDEIGLRIPDEETLPIIEDLRRL